MTPEVWRIVIVDDSPDDRAEARRLLLKGSGRRYAFTEAETGAAGIRAVHEWATAPQRCIVLDYNLPDMAAPAFLAAISGSDGTPGWPVVVFTGEDSVETGRSALRAGAHDYIGKNWMTPQGLVRAVDNAVERWTMARELQLQTAAAQASEQHFQALAKATADNAYRMSADWSSMRPLGGRELIPSADTPLEDWAWLDRIMPRDEHPRVRQAIAIAIAQKALFTLEHRVFRPDGSIGWTLSRAVPVLDENDRLVEWFGAASDITQRKAAEQALSDQDVRKDEFLATLSHELRNPLAPIRSGVALLQVTSDPEQSEKTFRMINRQLGHLLNIVDDLLDISRVRSGKLTLRAERVVIHEVVDAAVEACRPIVDVQGHTLELVLPDEPLVVVGDQTRLVQVVANLLTNSAKYSEPGGHIQVVVERDGVDVVIRVADTGTGIAAETLPTLWDMFTQVRDTLDKAQGGLGIGLSLVKRLVELHGGTVEAESPGVGRGSRFTVRLQLAEASAAAVSGVPAVPAPQPRVEALPLTRRRILVVDDNRDAAESLATLLELCGNQTLIAYDGAEAVDAAASFRPGVVLLDIGLPIMNGYEAARKIREQPWGAGMVLVALTGWGSDEHRRKSQAAGFDGHLVKPVDLPEIMKMLDDLEVAETRPAGACWVTR